MLEANHHVILGAIEAIKLLAEGRDPAILLKRTLAYLTDDPIIYWLNWYGVTK